jgi:DNA polymerase III subunit epsilon
MTRGGVARDPLAVLRRLIAFGDWVALDTETTDLGPRAEIVELAIVSADGQEFQTLVKPLGASSREAAQVHRIDPDALTLAPPFADVAGEVRKRLARRTVLAYNVAFDRRVLWQAFAQAVQPAPRSRWLCVCDVVTQWAGSRLRLDEALVAAGVNLTQPRHRAAEDARAVAALARALAAGGR